MRPADDVWNRALSSWVNDNRTALRAGDRALAGLLRFHGRAMNSGVLYALESADEQEFTQAVTGYRYYGFDDIAALLERAFPQSEQLDAMTLSAADALEAELDDTYTQRIPLDQVIVEAFEEHLAARPDEYAPIPR